MEKAKTKLCLKIDFNLKDLFAFFDIGGQGFIDAHALELICVDLGVMPKNSSKHLKAIKRFIY